MVERYQPGSLPFDTLLADPGERPGMPLDRETVYQIVITVGAVALFTGVAAVISQTYRTNDHISSTGGLALVGAIVLFILVMGGAGLWLNSQEFADES